MKFDIIEIEMTCEKTSLDDCLEYGACKYDYYCTNYKKTDFATMIYSEGE